MDTLLRSLAWILYLSCVYPLAKAWWANQRTSLRDTVGWLWIAWLSWLAAFAFGDPNAGTPAGTYFALCLTGCVGVAVLGARRPGATAWNFVVLALVVVQSMPLLESALRGGRLELDGLRLTCLAATLAVGVLNYLPTMFAPASLFLLAVCGMHLSIVVKPDFPERQRLELPAHVALACVPWLALACTWSRRNTDRLDRLWFRFRDCYGLVWGQRLREQFNRSAQHAGLPVALNWAGFRVTTGVTQEDWEKADETLRALMKRFSDPGNRPG